MTLNGEALGRLFAAINRNDMQAIIEGAVDNGLPEDYIEALRLVETA